MWMKTGSCPRKHLRATPLWHVSRTLPSAMLWKKQLLRSMKTKRPSSLTQISPKQKIPAVYTIWWWRRSWSSSPAKTEVRWKRIRTTNKSIFLPIRKTASLLPQQIIFLMNFSRPSPVTKKKTLSSTGKRGSSKNGWPSLSFWKTTACGWVSSPAKSVPWKKTLKRQKEK